MTREKLNNLIGKTVMVEFRSGKVIRGKLGFTKEFSEKYGWRKPNYYTVDEYDFLVSHIKSIKEVYAMTRKEARDVLQEQIDRYGQEYDDEGIEALEVAIKELEKEPCEDCISRKQAIKATYGFERYTRIDEAPYEYAESILRDLPSVTPKIKKGKWIVEVWNNKEHHTCSSCQHVIDYEPCYHYCPMCGAEMEGEE